MSKCRLWLYKAEISLWALDIPFSHPILFLPKMCDLKQSWFFGGGSLNTVGKVIPRKEFFSLFDRLEKNFPVRKLLVQMQEQETWLQENWVDGWTFYLPNFQACFLFYLLTILSSLLPRLSKTFKLSNFQMDFLFTKLSILLPVLFTKLSDFQMDLLPNFQACFLFYILVILSNETFKLSDGFSIYQTSKTASNQIWTYPQLDSQSNL